MQETIVTLGSPFTSIYSEENKETQQTNGCETLGVLGWGRLPFASDGRVHKRLSLAMTQNCLAQGNWLPKVATACKLEECASGGSFIKSQRILAHISGFSLFE